MSQFEPLFHDWLRSKLPALEGACARAMRAGLQGVSSRDLAAANSSASRLYAKDDDGEFKPGADTDYHFRGVGALYTGHWHGKRVHDSLHFMVPLRRALSENPALVIDIGAGTGAALWAWTLVACFADEIGMSLPIHRWRALDASEEMLEQSDRLWRELCAVIPRASEVVVRRPSTIGSWRCVTRIPPNSVIVGSFLFSRRDCDCAHQIASQFAGLLQNNAAAKLLTWTTPSKRRVLEQLRKKLSGWVELPHFQQFISPLKGQMRACIDVAAGEFKSAGIEPDDDWERRFNWGGSRAQVEFLALRRTPD